MIAIVGAAVAALMLGIGIRSVVGTDRARGVLVLLAVVVVVTTGAGTANADPTAYVVSSTAAAVLLIVAIPGKVRLADSRVPGAVAIIVTVFYTLNVIVTGIANPVASSSMLWVGVLAVPAVFAARRLGPQGRTVLINGIGGMTVTQVLVAAAVIASAGTVPLWTAPVLLPNPLLDGIDRATGTLTHPILFGALCAVAAIIALTAWRGVLRWGGLTVFTVGMVLSGSRSALLGVVLVTAFLLVTSARGGRTARVVFGLGLGGIVVTLSTGLILDAFNVLLDSGSYSNRAGALESLPALLERPVLENLFGAGFGSEDWLREQGYLNQNGFPSVDNQFVTTVATQGLTGLLVLLVLVVFAFRKGDRFQRAVTILFVVLQFTFDDLRSSFGVVVLLTLLAMRAEPAASEPTEHTAGPADPLTTDIRPNSYLRSVR